MNIFGLLLVFFQVFVCLLSLNFRIGKHGKRVATFEQWNNTCGERTVVIIYSYTNMRGDRGKFVMDSSITVKEDVTNVLNLFIRIEKCNNRENLDTCEQFRDYRLDNYCMSLEPTNMWGFLYLKYVPKYKCPLKKGIYNAPNSTVDMRAMLGLSGTFFWRLKAEVRDTITDEMAMCLMVDARMVSL